MLIRIFYRIILKRGLTNKFLIRTRHPLALRYNDRNVLENYHVASIFELIKDRDDINIFKMIERCAMRKMRKLIIETVMATDISLHFKLFNKLKTKLEGDLDPKNDDDLFVILILNMLIINE